MYIYTDFIDAWNESLIYDNKRLLWEYYNNGYINVDLDDPTSPTRIEITPGTKDLDVEITVVKIGARIGPGFYI